MMIFTENESHFEENEVWHKRRRLAQCSVQSCHICPFMEINIVHNAVKSHFFTINCQHIAFLSSLPMDLLELKKRKVVMVTKSSESEDKMLFFDDL